MAKTLALGTKLYVESNTPGTYIAVGNLTSVPVPSAEKGEAEVTDMDSTAKEFLPTLPDNGTLDFGGYFNIADPGQVLLLDDANNPNAPTRNWRVDFVRQNVRFSFAGFVRRAAPTAPGAEEAYTFEGSIRVTGAVTRVSPIPA